MAKFAQASSELAFVHFRVVLADQKSHQGAGDHNLRQYSDTHFVG
ncbi:Uncharacterised protein [Vibrio cholerae]|nr:Uncharacterised protein [Vibrio cholerae]CSC84980.1 Uncharacterised protein [Vibrio cholerae]CSD03562.1 Uncharacterised protein [Vibrio cholerae]